MILSNKAIEDAFDSLERRSRDMKYRDDPVLWAEEVLGVFLWSKQKEILSSLVYNKKTAVKSCHAIGKGVPLDTIVPTSTGLVRFGDLQVGDYVLDVYGNPTEITYVSSDKFLTNYEVVFDDGSVVHCDADHLWQVQDLTKRRRKVVDWRDHWDNTDTVNVVELKNNLRTVGGQYRWRVPIARALQRPHNDSLPLDPYILGIWLGDGSVGNKTFCGGDTKLFYADLLPDIKSRPEKKPDSQAVNYTSAILREGLLGAGIGDTKHIPDEYLWNTSESQRRALLAGIMDSDGFVGTSNGIDLTNKRLSDDVMQLLHTLGVKASRKEGVAAYTKNGERIVTGTRYRISFTTSWNPFRNRGENWTPPKTSKHTLRTIHEIREVESVVTRCITVDNELSCYLVGREFIPTHNTFISAVAACWWISTRPHGVVRSTAPTSYQVHDLLWKEIRTMHAEHKLVGEVNQKDEWKTNVNGAINTAGSGKKPSDTNIHAFHGVHAREGVLTILDEGCGIAESLFTAADAISTGRLDRVLTVGNPDDPNTPFGDIFLKVTPENEDIWHRITVSAFDTPNFTGEEVPDVIKDGTLQPEWVDARAREWGIDSGRYRSKILGEFPSQSDNSFFSQRAIYNAYETTIEDDPNADLILGVDIAGSGEDDTVIYGNRNGRVRRIASWSEGNALYTAKKIVDVAVEVGATEVRIDNGGFGKGVIDIIIEDPRIKDMTIIRMNGGATPTDPSAHLNRRAENYDNLRMGMELGRFDLDQEDKKLGDQLLAVQYEITQRGAIQMESKRDLRKGGGKSPDELDAVVYCTADLSAIFDADESKNINHLDPRDYFDNMPGWALIRW